jgi:hypothetical protein
MHATTRGEQQPFRAPRLRPHGMKESVRKGQDQGGFSLPGFGTWTGREGEDGAATYSSVLECLSAGSLACMLSSSFWLLSGTTTLETIIWT